MMILFIFSLNCRTYFRQLFIASALNFNTFFIKACHMIGFFLYQSDVNLVRLYDALLIMYIHFRARVLLVSIGSRLSCFITRSLGCLTLMP